MQTTLQSMKTSLGKGYTDQEQIGHMMSQKPNLHSTVLQLGEKLGVKLPAILISNTRWLLMVVFIVIRTRRSFLHSEVDITTDDWKLNLGRQPLGLLACVYMYLPHNAAEFTAVKKNEFKLL